MDYNKEHEACLDAFCFGTSFVFPMVFQAAIELNVFGIIAKAGPGARLSAAEIVSQLPTTNPKAAEHLDRMLLLLATHSLLTCTTSTSTSATSPSVGVGDEIRLYGLTPACKYFIPDRNENEGSLAFASTLAHHPATLATWVNLKEVILEGGDIFKKIHGMSAFEYMDKDPTYSDVFYKAMVGISTLAMKGVLDVYKGFEGLSSLVDVGGGTGKTLNMIIAKYPYIKGINFDLPHVVKIAPSYPGIEHIGGDMCVSVPKGEAIMTKEVCHNWDDETCLKLLKNCYEALPENGKMIIINLVMPEQLDASRVAKQVTIMDNVMLSQFGGKQRTAKEFQALCNKAGFSNFHIACFAQGNWAVMESYKIIN